MNVDQFIQICHHALLLTVLFHRDEINFFIVYLSPFLQQAKKTHPIEYATKTLTRGYKHIF